MGLASVTNKLGDWIVDMHDSMANVSEGTLKKADAAVVVVAVAALGKVIYGMHTGNFCLFTSVGVVWIVKTGVDYVKSIKASEDADRFAIQKWKEQASVVS